MRGIGNGNKKMGAFEGGQRNMKKKRERGKKTFLRKGKREMESK